jgi:carbonic anhydrase
MIIGCVDPRVDPALLFGLEPGEAVVIRNIGGRITPATLQTMAMLQTLAQAQGANPRAGYNIIVLHHTDCGITRMAGKTELMASYFGIDQADLEMKAIMDPRKAVAIDVAMLKNNPILPAGWAISGLVYDVTTGLVETVVPPALLS